MWSCPAGRRRRASLPEMHTESSSAQDGAKRELSDVRRQVDQGRPMLELRRGIIHPAIYADAGRDRRRMCRDSVDVVRPRGSRSSRDSEPAAGLREASERVWTVIVCGPTQAGEAVSLDWGWRLFTFA